MDLRDISSLNREFRSLRLLAGDLGWAPVFRHYSLWRQDAPAFQPGDCVIAIEAELPRDEEALLPLLNDPALSSVAGVILRAGEEYELPPGRYGGSPPILALPLSTDLDYIIFSLQAALQGESCYLDYINHLFEQELSRLSGVDDADCAGLLSLLRSYLHVPVLIFSDQYVLRQPCASSLFSETARSAWRSHTPGAPFRHTEGGSVYCFYPVTDSWEAIASLCTVYPEGKLPTEADEMLVAALLPRLSLCILRSVKKTVSTIRIRNAFSAPFSPGTLAPTAPSCKRTRNSSASTAASSGCSSVWSCCRLRPCRPHQRPADQRLFSALHCRFFSLQTGASLIYITECDTLQSTLSEFRRSVLPQMASLSNNTGIRICIGVSSEFTDLLDLPRALSEAEFSQEIGKKLNPGQLLYSYDAYILYHLLDNIRKAPGVYTIHSEIILKLYEYDQQNSTELLPTFLCLCKYNFNALQAAEEMYLHRNSLYKRMERISSVLGMDFDSVDNLIIFHLAAKLHALFN